MPPDGSRPTGSLERGGEIPLRVDRPPQDPSDQAGTGRSNIEIGSRSIDRVYTGSTRAPIPIAALCGLSAQPPRKHLPPALFRMKPRGASGQDRWQQRFCTRTSAAEQGLEAGSRQRSRRRGSQPRRRPAQRPATARRYRPSVTTGRLLTRGTLRRVGHDGDAPENAARNLTILADRAPKGTRTDRESADRQQEPKRHEPQGRLQEKRRWERIQRELSPDPRSADPARRAAEQTVEAGKNGRGGRRRGEWHLPGRR